MRQIGVSYSGFVDESYTLLSLFDDVEQIEKIIDFRQLLMLSETVWFLAIQKGTVLTEVPEILNAVNLSVVIPRVDWRD